jgi:hypothetical protein
LVAVAREGLADLLEGGQYGRLDEPFPIIQLARKVIVGLAVQVVIYPVADVFSHVSWHAYAPSIRGWQSAARARAAVRPTSLAGVTGTEGTLRARDA